MPKSALRFRNFFLRRHLQKSRTQISVLSPVHRILLIRKNFEHCIQLCQHIQAQMLDIEAGQLQRAAALPNLCVTQNQCLQTVAVDLCYFREVEYDIHDIVSRERVYRGTKGRFRVACFQLSSQIENPNPLFSR